MISENSFLNNQAISVDNSIKSKQTLTTTNRPEMRQAMRLNKQTITIILGASLLLSIAMGLRQSLGIFMPGVTHDLGVSVSNFTIAIAVQNLSWGVLQPFVGALAIRIGFRPLMLGGAALYTFGLLLFSLSQGFWGVVVGAGVAIGCALAATGSAISMSVSAKAVPPALRSSVLGIVSAVGSLGALVAAPAGQIIAQEWGWRLGVGSFVLLGLLMLPAAWLAGKIDTEHAGQVSQADEDLRFKDILSKARGDKAFVILAGTYFVCGMQLVFLTTHLPAYLDICGMDPMLSAKALGVIGGFNVLGSLFFGWMGGRFNKLVLLGSIYTLRSIGFFWYFTTVPTPNSTLVFAAIMGFLWLGVAPLVSGWIAQTFGLKWQAMLVGIAFCCHQFGSFFGAYGGGILYDLMHDYSLAWRVGAMVGLLAGIFQMTVGLRIGGYKNHPQL